MQSENRLFEDLVKMMNGAAGTFAGMGREAESSMRQKMREWVGGLDMVSREEFDAVKAMAIAARDENDALKKRIDALEAAAKPAKAPKAPKAGA
ncbi:accessory factor UbiK family protein [Sphingomonas rhizophila]|uniref:Accessory factor UbiK family protein n=1 Tax=Sphingomonas rhizophila TaxID=2071607 RepID=A0A7G9SCU0_9SPHN|nr:accessory factor UbiK family protein [Sphingomonas rhizophila]QNN65665.1 accessory factor UbiK family protein [Sphingomonas rhizophila]